MTRLYLQKNDITKNPKLPYFTLKVVPEEGAEDQDWKEIGAFWKSKSGVGYSGTLSEGVVIDTTNLVPFKKKDAEEEEEAAVEEAKNQD